MIECERIDRVDSSATGHDSGVYSANSSYIPEQADCEHGCAEPDLSAFQGLFGGKQTAAKTPCKKDGTMGEPEFTPAGKALPKCVKECILEHEMIHFTDKNLADACMDMRTKVKEGQSSKGTSSEKKRRAEKAKEAIKNYKTALAASECAAYKAELLCYRKHYCCPGVMKFVENSEKFVKENCS